MTALSEDLGSESQEVSRETTVGGVNVLVFCPYRRDGEMIAKVLEQIGIQTHLIDGPEAFCERLRLGEGDIAIVAEESLSDLVVGMITRALSGQPRWSDYPLIVLGVPDSSSGVGLFERLSPVANLTLLERPTRPFTLATVVRGAVRSRARQLLTREHLAELERSRAEAERVGRMKDEFLGTLSHELRTPLNAISGWVTLLQRGGLDETEARSGLDTIARNTLAQRRLIDELLDMSRIISGKVRLEPQKIDLRDLVGDAVASVSPTARSKGVDLCMVNGAGADRLPTIWADPARLMQAMWNLVTNAIKFTPAGGNVEVELSGTEHAACIRVTDNGMGISQEFLPFVFDRFRQADSTSRRSHGGLGLGLSIVRQLVEMHGGSVAAFSRGEGKGSTFQVVLPLRGASHEGPLTAGETSAGSSRVKGGGPTKRERPYDSTAAQAPRITLDGLRVLVVDDDDDGRALIERFLCESGACVRSVPSVHAAREALAAGPVDVLLSDIAMPGEDGYDLIRWVRTQGPAASRGVRAAALSAFARHEDRQRSLECGFDAHFTKPFEPDDLVSKVGQLRVAPSRG